MSNLYNPLKQIQDAWVRMLLDFRAWFVPTTTQTKDWKFRETYKAIRSCQSRLIDDVEGMLVSFRKNNNEDGQDRGTSSFMPIMLTATAMVDALPAVSQLMGVPYFVDVVIDNKIAKMRIEPIQVRCQVAFFATNPHDARAMAGQLCTYLTDDSKRKIDVPFYVAQNVKDDFKFIIFENDLYPTIVPSEALNISIFTVDVYLAGYIPHVIGTGLDSEEYVDNGFDENGIPRKGSLMNDSVVKYADMLDKNGRDFSINANDTETNIDTLGDD